MRPDHKLDKLADVRPEIFLAIQLVDVHHGKADRGGAGARARRAAAWLAPADRRRVRRAASVSHERPGRLCPRTQGWARIALQLPASHAQRPPQSIVFGWQSAVHETAAQSGWAPTGAQLLA